MGTQNRNISKTKPILDSLTQILYCAYVTYTLLKHGGIFAENSISVASTLCISPASLVFILSSHTWMDISWTLSTLFGPLCLFDKWSFSVIPPWLSLTGLSSVHVCSLLLVLYIASPLLLPFPLTLVEFPRLGKLLACGGQAENKNVLLRISTSHKEPFPDSSTDTVRDSKSVLVLVPVLLRKFRTKRTGSSTVCVVRTALSLRVSQEMSGRNASILGSLARQSIEGCRVADQVPEDQPKSPFWPIRKSETV